MGILARFKDIMAANINALLDKAEDPEKMIDQTMRNLTADLGKVKEETAAVMADEQRCKRELDECNKEIAEMQAYAEKAVLAGNDEDAAKFASSVTGTANNSNFNHIVFLIKMFRYVIKFSNKFYIISTKFLFKFMKSHSWIIFS